MSKDGGIRQRAVVQDEDNPARAAPSEKVNPTSSTETTGGIGFVDVLRIIVGLALVSTVGSYLITSGESLTWGIRRPWFTKLSGLQQSMVSRPPMGPHGTDYTVTDMGKTHRRARWYSR